MMTLKQKVIAATIIVVLSWGAVKVTTPVARLASNRAIVSQMDNTDASTLAVQAVGNGEWIPRAIIGFLAIGSLAFIFTRKTKEG
jgi:hypothetical protein